MTIYSLDVLLSRFGTNLLFLSSLTVASSPAAGQVVRYSHLFQNFSRLVVIHTVKGFGVVNKAEVDVFMKSLAFSMVQRMLAILSQVLLPVLNPACTSGSSWYTYC